MEKLTAERLRADGMLLVAAIIWGTAFVAQKYGNDAIPPLLFVGMRFLLSAVLLAPFARREVLRSPPLSKRDYRISIIIGLLLFIGCALQQIGLLNTTATNAGFLTALYVIFIPFVEWIMWRKRISPLILMACTLSIAGAWLLSGFNAAQPFSTGDLLVVFCSLATAVYLAVLGRFSASNSRPYFISFIQYAVTGVLGVVISLMTESFTWQGLHQALPAILYAGGISGGIAFTLQIKALRHTPAAEGSLIMSLEGVFAAIAGAILLHERLTPAATFGCLLILLGIVLVEIIPLWKNRSKLS